MVDHCLLYVFLNSTKFHSICQGGCKRFFFFFRHESVKITWLFVMRIWVRKCISPSLTFHVKTSLGILRVDISRLLEVWFMIKLSSLVAICHSWTISLSIDNSCSVWTVDRNIFIIHSKSVSLGIRVGKQSSLQKSAV